MLALFHWKRICYGWQITKKTNRLAASDVAYLAGLIDGEGRISLSRKHKKDQRQLVVSIGNNENPLLTYVRSLTGAGFVTNKKVYSQKHAPHSTYKITNRQALDLLRQVTPYMQSYKRQRAELVLAKYIALTPRNGKYSPLQLREKEKLI